MSGRSDTVTADVLRRWGLPDPGESKKSRGDVVVIGGSRRTPGGVLLAGEAALRVGAGRLALLVPDAIQTQLGVAVPEAAVLALPNRDGADLDDAAREAIRQADVVLIGPGFDDARQTLATIGLVAACNPAGLVLDAFALGVLPDVDRAGLPALLILTPNEEEAAILLGRDPGVSRAAALAEISRRYDAVVACYGDVAAADGRSWSVEGGGPGLGTSGSGDVLAGAVAGFAARGVEAGRAAVWGSWAHARAGDRLTARTGLGFLARDLAVELTATVHEAVAGGG